jgi:hypothetical protein
MKKTVTIPKVAFEKVLKEIIADYPKEAISVSSVEYDYLIEAEESIFNDLIGVIGTKIHRLQQVQNLLRQAV